MYLPRGYKLMFINTAGRFPSGEYKAGIAANI